MSLLIQHYPNQAYDKLEEVSFLIKNAEDLPMDKFLKVSDFRNYKEVCTQMEEYITALKY